MKTKIIIYKKHYFLKQVLTIIRQVINIKIALFKNYKNRHTILKIESL